MTDKQKCETCGGDGALPEDYRPYMQHAEGSATEIYWRPLSSSIVCPTCHGTGKQLKETKDNDA